METDLVHIEKSLQQQLHLFKVTLQVIKRDHLEKRLDMERMQLQKDRNSAWVEALHATFILFLRLSVPFRGFKRE